MIEEAAATNPGPQGDGAREALKDRPELTAYEQSFWDSYWECHTMRPIGFGAAPIPFDAISHYCAEYEIRGTDRIIFRRIMRRLDNAFTSAIRKKDKAAAK